MCLRAYGRLLGGRLGDLGRGRRRMWTTFTPVISTEDLTERTTFMNTTRVGGGSGASTLGSTAVGQVNMDSWYKLSVKVHGSGIEVFKDGVLRINTSSSQHGSGGVALYGERNTVAQFNNVLVRKYAVSRTHRNRYTLEERN